MPCSASQTVDDKEDDEVYEILNPTKVEAKEKHVGKTDTAANEAKPEHPLSKEQLKFQSEIEFLQKKEWFSKATLFSLKTFRSTAHPTLFSY